MSEGQKKTLGLAIASLVCGCLFIIPLLGILLSLTAIILGVIALVKISKDKDNLKGNGLAISGIVLGAVGIIIIPIVSLLAAIAIPNLLRARVSANENSAQADVRTIATALETYAAANYGNYPTSEYNLLDAEPPFLTDSYDNKTVNGYDYSLDLRPDNYRITAAPSKCGTTGTKVFVGEMGGKFGSYKCE